MHVCMYIIKFTYMQCTDRHKTFFISVRSLDAPLALFLSASLSLRALARARSLSRKWHETWASPTFDSVNSMPFSFSTATAFVAMSLRPPTHIRAALARSGVPSCRATKRLGHSFLRPAHLKTPPRPLMVFFASAQRTPQKKCRTKTMSSALYRFNNKQTIRPTQCVRGVWIS